jgi:hypothetical protein
MVHRSVSNSAGQQRFNYPVDSPIMSNRQRTDCSSDASKTAVSAGGRKQPRDPFLPLTPLSLFPVVGIASALSVVDRRRGGICVRQLTAGRGINRVASGQTERIGKVATGDARTAASRIRPFVTAVPRVPKVRKKGPNGARPCAVYTHHAGLAQRVVRLHPSRPIMAQVGDQPIVPAVSNRPAGLNSGIMRP